MAGQPYTWQVSTASNTLPTGPGRISSAYNVDGKTPLTTVTQANPDGFVPVNTLSSDPVVSKTEYKIDQDGVITYRYTGASVPIIYDSVQELIDNRNVSASVGYQIRSAVGSSIIAEARQKNIGQGAIGLPSLPPSANTQGTQNGPDPNTTTITQDVITNLTQINPEDPNPPFEDLVYPTNIRNNGQDFIKFAVVKYVPRKLDISGGIGVLQERGKLTDILGNIILPIQPSISDSNNVDWNGLGVNPLEMQLVDTSLNLMSASTQADVQSLIDNAVDKGQKTFSDQNVQRAIKLYFAQKAAGVTGLLSRVSGAIVNPNLELLFQGPTLRPFNFTFRLSPRDNAEATQVRKIIRAFKQYSAVGTASDGLFLTTPNVFNIQYISKRNGNEENHKSLNKIKTCALKSVSVDYTPDGSYMTFNDEARTMTSYNLTLQFQELEPVTTKDYKPLTDKSIIGY